MYEGHYATREDIDAAMRYGCGYPMGPLALLDLIGLDTAYEILDTMYKQGRDRLHAPAPILKQMVTAGLLGRKIGPRLLHLRGAGQLRSSRRPPHPVGGRPARAQRRHLPRRRGRHRHHGGGHRRGLRQGRLRRARTSAARPDKVEGVRATIERSLDKADPARQARGVRPRARCSAALTGSTSLDDLADVDIVVEAIAEDLRIKTTLFENLDEICKPGAILATTTSSLPIIECATATDAAAGRHRHALLQPGAGHEAGRGRLHRRHRRRRGRDGPRAVREDRQGARSPAATGPASSSTRCCSPTSTTRSRCSRRTTPRPTTSTPR